MLNMALGKMQTPMMPEIPSQTLQKAALRIISSITKQEPALQMHTFIAGSQIPANTTDLWFAAGIPSDASYAQMLSSGEDGTNFSFAIKIGPQIKLVSSPVDAKNFITSAFASLDPVYYKDTFGQLLKDLSDSYRNQKQVRAITTTMVRVNPDIPVSINNKQKDTVTPDMELDDFYRIKRNLRKKIQKVFVDLINKSTSLKTNIIHQCLTGKGKFVDPTGFATHMICSSMDGTNAKIIPLNLQYCRTVAKGVNTELNIIFTELPPSETSIIDDIADTGTKKSGQPLSEQKESQSLAQTLEKVFKDLEKDPILLLEAFGLDIENIVYINPINYQDYYFPIISNYNSVTFNPGHADQEEISISVEDDEINRKNDKIESGNELMEAYILMNDYLVDSIKNNKLCLEEALQLLNEEFDLLCERRERNYKKEYREYHGKPEQIKRRAGRVTARRKAIRQGKVRKGDKKDVHHEDGNPKNNSSDNLKIMSRSRNRSIKEEHGAGDIGTDELRKKFVKETPFMIDPIKFVDRFKKKK
jgi:hypothetical protein